jgi:hypothetical protein
MNKKVGEIHLLDRETLKFVDVPMSVEYLLQKGVLVGGEGYTPSNDPVEFFHFCSFLSNGFLNISGKMKK